MGLTPSNQELITFKKVSGKAHTQQNFAISEESITTNVQSSFATVFGQNIEPLPVTNSGLTSLYSTNGIIQRIKFPIDIIPNTQIGVNQSQGYRLKLPADWNIHPGALYPEFVAGTYLHSALGKLQIIPALYGTLKSDGTTEYDPILTETNGTTVISKFDPINWYLDPYNGVLFVEDPPAGYDVSSARPGFIEAFLFVGNYVDDILNLTSSGNTGTTASNVGSGIGVFKTKIGQNLEFKSLFGSGGILVTGGTNDIIFSFTGATGGGGGTVTGATNGLSITGKNIKLGGILTGATTIGLGTNSIIFTGTTGTLKYGSDLSSNFGKFSIVDKNYVTGITNTLLTINSFNIYTGNTLTSINNRLLTSSFNIYSGNTNTLISTKIDSANNGLTKSNNNVHLGGILTGATTIGLGTNSIIFTGTTGTLKYGSDLSSNFGKFSIVDKNYVTGTTSTLIGGSDKQIQINHLGKFSGYTTFTFNPSTKKLNLNGTDFYSPTGTSSGDRNIFIGNSVGVSSPSNGLNVGIGDFSLSSLTSGSQNTGIGTYTLLQLSTGSQNTAIGYIALGNGILTGNRNTAIGRSTLSSLTIGSDLVGIGYNAGGGIRSGTTSIFIGSSAGATANGFDNVAIGGQNCGNNLTTASENVFIGTSSGAQYVSGSGRNTAVGVASLENAHNGTENSFFGYAAGSENGITGSYNTVIGGRAMSDYGFSHGTSGSYNTALGHSSLTSIQTGNYNIAIGYATSSNNDPTVMISGGSQNIAIGYRANIADGNKDGQLSIQNAIYGSGNTLNSTGDAIAKGNIGFYTKLPSARVHFPAGKTSAGSAPIKIDAGNLMTTPEANAIENNGNHIYWTSSGGTRYQLDQRTDIRTITGNTTINIFNQLILVDTSTTIIVTLPTSVPDGKWFTIKDKSGNAGTHNITVNPNGVNIDGGSSSIINTNYGAITVTYSSSDSQYYVTGFVN